jgi:hypothetical protein
VRKCVWKFLLGETMAIEFIHKPGDTYLVTGTLYRSNKKFRQVHSNPHYAMGINLWSGRVYQVRDGKRKLVKKVVN